MNGPGGCSRSGVFDNLVKGASGRRRTEREPVVLGLPETTGLPTVGMWP